MRSRLGLTLMLLWAPTAGLAGQQDGSGASTDGPALEVATPVTPTAVTPGGAFLRSVLVPGWGHSATGAYGRAGFYVTAQAGSLWMLVQTMARHAVATDALAVERRAARERVLVSGAIDPVPPEDEVAYGAYLDEITRAVDADPGVERLDRLVESRDQQVEDWAAMSIFLVLLGATDAFVAAHLADYPEPLSLDVRPGVDGGVELAFSVPFGTGR